MQPPMTLKLQYICTSFVICSPFFAKRNWWKFDLCIWHWNLHSMLTYLYSLYNQSHLTLWINELLTTLTPAVSYLRFRLSALKTRFTHANLARKQQINTYVIFLVRSIRNSARKSSKTLEISVLKPANYRRKFQLKKFARVPFLLE